MISGQWFVPHAEEKRGDQKSVIPYLAVEVEANFEFQSIAYYYLKDGRKPENIPEQLHIYIESFKSVN